MEGTTIGGRGGNDISPRLAPLDALRADMTLAAIHDPLGPDTGDHPVARSNGHVEIDLTESEAHIEVPAPGTNGNEHGSPGNPTNGHGLLRGRARRGPWIKPRVLVLGDELPIYLTGAWGFQPLSRDRLKLLVSDLAAGRRFPGSRMIAVRYPIDDDIKTDLERLALLGIPVVPLHHAVHRRYRLQPLEEAPPTIAKARARAVLTRALDLILGTIGLLALLLTLPFVALAILIEDGRPIFYRQERIGRVGRPFMLWKFRSMKADAEASGAMWATSDDERITKVGRVIRRYKIDEFPQFLNVLAGHMSIVGPRPERPTFVEILRAEIPHYETRHLVRPGITGWGTLRVGYSNSIEAKFAAHLFDLYHITNRSLLFDVEIIVRSLYSLARSPKTIDRYML